MPADTPLTITELDALLRDEEPDEYLSPLSRRVLSTMRHLLIVHDYLESRVRLMGDRIQWVEAAIGTPVRPLSGDETFQP